MSKIVAIVSSPITNGNSDSIVEAMLDGAMGLSTNEIILYRLDKFRAVHGCRACMHCKSAGTCAQNDDISDILTSIRDADAVIVSTPVYFGNACAQYKILEDRMFSFLDASMRSTIAPGKTAMIVVSCGTGTEGANAVADNLENTYRMLGFDVTDKIVYSDVNGPAKDNEDLMDKAERIGSKLCNTRARAV